MFAHFGKTLTATARGHGFKSVVCEKCATEFQYEISRVCAGYGYALGSLHEDGALQRAEKSARTKLARRLENDVELVPCPSCKWVNLAVITRYQESKYREWTWGARAIFFLGLLVGFVLFVNFEAIFKRPASPLAAELLLELLVTVILTLLVFIVQRWLRQRINPNRLVNGKPDIPFGTPPALIKQDSPDGGPPTLVAVPSELSNLQTEARWVTVRADGLSLEPFCCQCLAPPTVKYRLPVPFNDVGLPVPLCRACLRRLRIQWCVWNLCMLPIAALIGWGLACLPVGLDDFGRIFLAVILGGLVSLKGFVIVERWLRPYRHRLVDRDRAIYRIRFKNPAYTALLIRRIGEQDGIYQPPALP